MLRSILLASMLALGAALSGCAADHETADASPAETTDDLTAVPPSYLPGWLAALEWMKWLKENYPSYWATSRRDEADPRPWRLGYDAQRDPVFAHDAIDVDGVAPSDVLALLAKGRSDVYYANSGPALDCETRAPVALTLGLRYCWTTFGTEQHMRVVELEDGEDEAVLAWEGGSAGVTVYHRWIMRRTSTGTRVVTEECERGLMPDLPLYRDRMNPALRAGHELWLHGLRDQLTQ